MSTVRATVEVPGARVADAEALWYDHRRWPSFVDGFGHVTKVEGDWPAVGARVTWDSPPNGRGRVVERVEAHEPRTGQAVAVEDPRIAGRQTVAFAPGDDGVTVTLELAYDLKEGGPLAPLTDRFFIRRAQRDALRRTLARFSRELQADLALRDEA